MNINYITYATHSERLYPILIESSIKHNINLHVIGYGNKWVGWKDRAQHILNYLNTIDNNAIVCHLDGFDSIILGSNNEIYEKLIQYSNMYDIVFSSDNNDNMFIKYFKMKKFKICRNNFISAGLYIGYKFKFKE